MTLENCRRNLELFKAEGRDAEAKELEAHMAKKMAKAKKVLENPTDPQYFLYAKYAEMLAKPKKEEEKEEEPKKPKK